MRMHEDDPIVLPLFFSLSLISFSLYRLLYAFRIGFIHESVRDIGCRTFVGLNTYALHRSLQLSSQLTKQKCLTHSLAHSNAYRLNMNAAYAAIKYRSRIYEQLFRISTHHFGSFSISLSRFTSYVPHAVVLWNSNCIKTHSIGEVNTRCMKETVTLTIKYKCSAWINELDIKSAQTEYGT